MAYKEEEDGTHAKFLFSHNSCTQFIRQLIIENVWYVAWPESSKAAFQQCIDRYQQCVQFQGR